MMLHAEKHVSFRMKYDLALPLTLRSVFYAKKMQSEYISSGGIGRSCIVSLAKPKCSSAVRDLLVIFHHQNYSMLSGSPPFTIVPNLYTLVYHHKHVYCRLNVLLYFLGSTHTHVKADGQSNVPCAGHLKSPLRTYYIYDTVIR